MARDVVSLKAHCILEVNRLEIETIRSACHGFAIVLPMLLVSFSATTFTHCFPKPLGGRHVRPVNKVHSVLFVALLRLKHSPTGAKGPDEYLYGVLPEVVDIGCRVCKPRRDAIAAKPECGLRACYHRVSVEFP